MDRLRALQVLVEVAERGSLTQAAEALGMSRAMVSRYLEHVETWLGARLLQRTTRRVSLTEAGSAALLRARQMLDLAREAEAAAGAPQQQARGRLRVTASASLAQACLAAAVAEFLAQHPACEVELVVVERAVNLVEERIDLAVRISNQLDPGLVARPLGRFASVLCAAPAYLASAPALAVPADLRQHRCVTHAYVNRTDYALQHQGEWLRVPVRAVLQSNDAAVMRSAALAGAGLAILPSYLVADDLRAGRLRRVLPDCEPESHGVHGVYLSRQYQPLALRLLLDALAERLGAALAQADAAARS
ncbi:LysR family transcriptional regulator [Roseateles sp. BYS87W]|uniref:LysR family transcriptional regulator n=1 Tax=Pelomonas baiyunensis TaxID=3299026 RepID=A0ABW7H3H2_9BURK